MRITKVNKARSGFGNVLNFLFLSLIAAVMMFPLVYIVNNAFKPLNELFMYPPKLFVQNPTFDNFLNFGSALNNTVIPFSRYLFNSVFITVTGVLGQIIIASLAAYFISKHDFFGRKFLMEIVITSLMFTGAVIAIPNYIIMTKMNLIDSHLAIILPSFCSSMGLFLMKQFMDQMIPHTLLEAARIDGAGELTIFAKVVMPICKPAWLTMLVFSFQGIWANTGGTYIFTEELKTLPHALTNIVSNGLIAMQGVSAAVALIMIVPPIAVFLISQSNVLDTMATSGIKD